MSVFTNLTGGGTSSVASATTASITPGGNRLILVTVHAYLSAGSVQPATPTVTGNGITYSLVASQDTDNSGTDRGTMFLFRGMASAPTAGGITIDFGATTQTRIQWAVDQSGPDVDTSGTNGSGAIIQSTGVTLGAAGTSASVNFPSAMGAGNVGFSAWGHQVQEGKTPRAGWTELADVTTVSLASVETQYISGTDTAGSASWTTSSRAGGIIAEIKSAIGIRGTTTSGTGDTNVSSKTVPVPTGAAVDDIAIIIVDQWTSATERTATITGFTEIAGAHATRATTGTAGTQTIRMFWKRLTAADTGNYTVTFSGTTWNMAHCVMFSGGLASGDPIEVVNTASATSGYPTASFTVSTLAGLVNSAVTFNAITTTPPTSFTEQQDTNVLHTNTRILTGTGSITASGGTSSETDTVVVAMIAVKPAAGSGGGAAEGGSSFAASALQSTPVKVANQGAVCSAANSPRATAVRVAKQAAINAAAATTAALRSTQSRPQSATTPAAAVASATAVKVARQSGVCSTSSTSTSTGRKVVAKTGVASAAPMALSTAAKKAPAAAATTLAGTTQARATKKTSAGGTTTTTTTTTATCRKVAAGAGQSYAAAFATRSMLIAPRAVSATCSAAGFGSGRAVKVAAAAATASAAGATRGNGTKRALPLAVVSAAGSCRGTSRKKAPVSATAAGAALATVAVRKISAARGMAYAAGYCEGRRRALTPWTPRPNSGTTAQPIGAPPTTVRPDSGTTQRPVILN